MASSIPGVEIDVAWPVALKRGGDFYPSCRGVDSNLGIGIRDTGVAKVPWEGYT